MDYYYPNSVVVITDNIPNYHSACHLFANQFRNANLITAHQRVNMIHNAAVIEHQGPEPKAATIVQLVKAHQYAMETLGDVNYYIKDVENAMLRAAKSVQVKPDSFNVIVVLDGLFSKDQIKRLKARKIYFYENRSEERKVIDKLDYCVDEEAYFQTLGYAGSMVNLSDSVETMYTQLGFKV